ncbi:hypothetical protein TNCV_1900051 [Trichonephila clavipes]|nr:hypothetical protein TNCV_1900051 [Trichonephila clavipes]
MQWPVVSKGNGAVTVFVLRCLTCSLNFVARCHKFEDSRIPGRFKKDQSQATYCSDLVTLRNVVFHSVEAIHRDRNSDPLIWSRPTQEHYLRLLVKRHRTAPSQQLSHDLYNATKTSFMDYSRPEN